MLTTALERLLARREPAKVNFGLDRIRALLEGIGNPELRYRAIHVAGTNGKGSVAATAESVLRAAGLRTGLYTSPHLLEFAERIVVDGRTAEPALLEEAAAELLPLAEEVDATFFESTTALAFSVFARAGVQAAVVEVGLGGRLDATNVLNADVAVITSIDLDHADYLGSDPAGIAREKAGIIKEGAAVVLGEVRDAARRELLTVAERIGVSVEAFGEAFHVDRVRETAAGIELQYCSARRESGTVDASSDASSGVSADPFTDACADARAALTLRSPLRGPHQAVNVAVAVAAVDAFTARLSGAWLAPPETVARAVAGVRWPGRFQIERDAAGPTFVYDIAHNPAAARLLADLVQRHVERGELRSPVVLLCAVLGDKDWRSVLGPLLDVCDDAVLTDAPSAPRGRRWDLHAAAAMRSPRAAPAVEPDFDLALARARELAGEGTVLVTGSCYTVGDTMRRRRELDTAGIVS